MATQTTSNSNWHPFVLEKRQPAESKASTTKDDSFPRPDLRLNVFVSKEGTSALAAIILPEPWGSESENLYKLIDYTWRAALFQHQVFQFTDRGNRCLVFHSGLQRRVDGEFIYFVLVPNDDDSKVQKWRIASVPTLDWSFQTAGDLLQFVDGNRDRLPKQTRFYDHPSEFFFDASAVINVDWVRMVEGCRERIIRAIVEEILILEDTTTSGSFSLLSRLPPRTSMKDVHIAIEQLRMRNYIVPELTAIRSAFSSAFDRAQRIIQANPGFAVPQGFVDTNKQECRLELLCPLFVDLDIGVGRSQKIQMCFCVALQKEATYNGYRGMSVLTAQMGYMNARLVGLVYQSWLLAAAWPDLYVCPLFTPVHRIKKEEKVASAPVQQQLMISPSAQLVVQHSAPPKISRYQPPSNRAQVADIAGDTRSRSLFVRNIPPTWSETVIRRKFSEIGPVIRVTMLPNRKKDSDKLLCLIEMKAANDAVTAIRRLHNATDENGLKVEQSRGARNTRRSGSIAASPSASTPPSIGSQKLTLEIQSVGRHQTATTFVELLKFADIEEDKLLWIVVHQPENYALVRFRTADQIERAIGLFLVKPGFVCKKIRNPNFSDLPNDTFWKAEGGDRLSRRVSARLEKTKTNEWFWEDSDDENSAKITRYSDTLASRSFSNSQASIPLIRVERTSWRAPSRWADSRLRKNTNPRKTPNKSKPKPPSNERSSLNPNAVAFDPDLKEDVDGDEAAPTGANFIPHNGQQWDVLRGTSEWCQLEQLVSGIRGLDVIRIVEWQRKEMAPARRGLLREHVWIASTAEHVQILENEGLLVEHGNAGRGRQKGFDVFNSPHAALMAKSMDMSEGGNLILCDGFLSSPEQHELKTKNWVRMMADSSTENGRVERIIPKFVYHTSFRRVGR